MASGGRAFTGCRNIFATWTPVNAATQQAVRGDVMPVVLHLQWRLQSHLMGLLSAPLHVWLLFAQSLRVGIHHVVHGSVL